MVVLVVSEEFFVLFDCVRYFVFRLFLKGFLVLVGLFMIVKMELLVVVFSDVNMFFVNIMMVGIVFESFIY